MKLEEMINMITTAKTDKDYNLEIYSFFNTRDALKKFIKDFCTSTQSVLIIPGMFITSYGKRIVSLALVLAKIDDNSLENIYTESIIDLDQFVELYGQEIPLKVPLTVEKRKLKNRTPKDSFIKIVNEIAKKCETGNFGVQVQTLEQVIKIHQCNSENTDLVLIGFRIDHA